MESIEISSSSTFAAVAIFTIFAAILAAVLLPWWASTQSNVAKAHQKPKDLGCAFKIVGAEKAWEKEEAARKVKAEAEAEEACKAAAKTAALKVEADRTKAAAQRLAGAEGATQLSIVMRVRESALSEETTNCLDHVWTKLDKNTTGESMDVLDVSDFGSKVDVANFQELLFFCDVNGDGKISKEEFFLGFVNAAMMVPTPEAEARVPNGFAQFTTFCNSINAWIQDTAAKLLVNVTAARRLGDATEADATVAPPAPPVAAPARLARDISDLDSVQTMQ